MKKTNTFTDLIVWQKAHKFVLELYKVTNNYPKSEIYSLIPQIRRAAISIPANIAEGYKRNSNKEKLRFYNISQGSVEEIRYYLILSKDLKYIKNTNLLDILEEVSKLLYSYIKTILNTGY